MSGVDGCPSCGASGDNVKERVGDPDGIYGSHVCVACGAELGAGDLPAAADETI